MKYKNGRSKINCGVIRAALIIMIAAVAAAASDPSSLTSMKAFCTTVEIHNLAASDTPENEPQEETQELEKKNTVPTVLL